MGIIHKRKIAMSEYRNNRKKQELGEHIGRLEMLIAKNRSELTTKEIIANVANQEFDDYEIDSHIEEVSLLEKFENIIRVQMLVSVCGYFEYSSIKLLSNIGIKENKLVSIIKTISNDKLPIIDTDTHDSLEGCRLIRNFCVHHNSYSHKENDIIYKAHKNIKGIKITPPTGLKKIKGDLIQVPSSVPGKGKIELEKDFLPNALSLHFDTLSKIQKYVEEKGP